MSSISDTPSTFGTRGLGVVPMSELLTPRYAADLSAPRDIRASGFGALDALLGGGFAPEDLVIVGGRPGVGKSVALVQWARNLARAGRDVVLACYEHSELLVMAQLLLIEVGESIASGIESVGARSRVDQLIAGRCTWEQAIEGDRTLSYAAAGMTEWAPRLHVLDRRGRSGGIDAIHDAVQSLSPEVLVVDHLAKVGGDAGHVAIDCKQLAVDFGATVIAAATTTDEGIATKRLRQAGLVDAATIAHEADIEILLNDKMSIVSRNHSAFDSVRAESFRSQVVFSVEKNRRGTAGVDLEFGRDFAHRRFETTGGYVAERLVDGVLVNE